MPEVFGVLDDLVAAGKLRHYGVSVEKVEEALKAIEYPGVQSVQIIYNLFRQRPAELLFEQTQKRGVGILARLPLSSGLLSGKMNAQSTFGADDHRGFNREGAAFDKGETFSGLDFGVGLEAVEAMRPLVPAGMSMAQMALRWIHDESGSHLHHSRWQEPRAGARQRGRRRPAPAARCDHAGAGRHLRTLRQAACTPTLVERLCNTDATPSALSAWA